MFPPALSLNSFKRLIGGIQISYVTCMFMFLTRMDSSNYEILPVVSVSLTPKVLRSADSGKDGINEGEQLAMLSTTPTTLSSRSLCLLDCAFARKAVTDI